MLKALFFLFRDRSNRPILILTFLGLLYGSIFFYLNVLKFNSFFSFEWEDDATESQVIYNIADSFFPHQTIFLCKYFIAHFKPILFLVAFFYKINPHVYTILFLISFSYGLCVLLVYKLAKNIWQDTCCAVLLSLIYLLYGPLHFITLGAIDANNFALPLLFLAIYFMHQRRFVAYLFTIVLSCLCKIDIPWIIFALGIYQVIAGHSKKWWLTTIAYSTVYGIFAIFFSAVFCRVQKLDSDWQRGIFYYLDPDSVIAICKFYVFNTQEALKVLLDPSHIRAFVMILWPLLFIPLFSFSFYIPLVMFAEILLERQFFNHDSYYLAPIVPFLFFSFIIVIKRIPFRWQKILILSLSLALCIGGLFSRNIIGNLSSECSTCQIHDDRFMDVYNIFDKRIYIIDDEDLLAWDFIKMVPDEAAVTASGDLLLALSSRARLYEFGFNHPRAEYSQQYTYAEYPNYDVDYILIHSKALSNGLSGHYASLQADDLKNEIDIIIKNFGFKIERQSGKFILLKRPNR